jgi:RNA polymerase sigma factor (sigma-70 family)
MSPKISIRLLASQSDQRLAALAGEGHERAFEALVNRYRRPLLRYCRRLRLGDARAEDVLQQAFLQAWLAFARGTDVRDVRPWLYRIVHNAAVNAKRGRADTHSELTEAMQAAAALDGESNLQRTMAVRDALADVAALPQMQQQAIFLTAVDGQSNGEVADVLGISEGALRGLLHRARTTLRSAAAALTPPPLLAWAAGGPGGAGPTAERLAELSAGGGAAGIGGLLLKGVVVAVTAGAVATGATVASSDSGGVKAAIHRRSHAAPAHSRPRGTQSAEFGPSLAPRVAARRRGSRGGSQRTHRRSRQGRDRGSRHGDDRLVAEEHRGGSEDGAGDERAQATSPAGHDVADDASKGSERQASANSGRRASGRGGSSGSGSPGGGKASGGGSGQGGSDDASALTGQAVQTPLPDVSQTDPATGSATAAGGGDESATADDSPGRGSSGSSGSDG